MLKVPQSGAIKITHYVNPHLFWFKYIDDSNDQLEVLENKISHFVNQKQPKTFNKAIDYEPSIGELVLVRHFSDCIDKWIRARVDHLEKYLKENVYILWAIDYGFPLSCKTRFIRGMDDYELQTFNVSSVFVGGLSNIVPATKRFNFAVYELEAVKTPEWSQNAIENVDRILSDAEFVKFDYECCLEQHLFGKLTITFYNSKSVILHNHLVKLDEAVLSEHFAKDYKSLNYKSYWEYQQNDRFYKISANTIQSFNFPAKKLKNSDRDTRTDEKVNEWQQRNEKSTSGASSLQNEVVVTPIKDSVQTEIIQKPVLRHKNPIKADVINAATQKHQSPPKKNEILLCEKFDKLKIPLNQRYHYAQNQIEKLSQDSEKISNLKLQKINRLENTNLVPAGFMKTTPRNDKPPKMNTSPTFTTHQLPEQSRTVTGSYYQQELRRDRFSTRNNQRLLIHGHESIVSKTSISSIAEANFSEEVHAHLKNLCFNDLYRIQSYGWPHLMRGNSLVVVNSTNTAKMWTYLPAVCSLISERVSDKKVVSGDGPVIIIICTNSSEVTKVWSHCKKLLSGSLLGIKCEAVHGFGDEKKVQEQLLNGIEILVTTVPCLIRLMEDSLNFFNPKRISTIVFDKIDIMYDRFPKDIETVYKFFCGPESAKNTQLIVTSRTWTKVLKKFCQRKDVLLCIGAYIEAAIYAGTEMSLKIASEDKQKLLEEITSHLADIRYDDELTVIVCNTSIEVQELVSTLQTSAYSLVSCDEKTNAFRLDEIREMLNPNRSREYSILIVTDEVLPDLDIRHAQHIIHFSLPANWTIFCQRFCLSFEYHQNLLQENKPTKGQATSVIFVDTKNYDAFPRLIDFMKTRCNAKIPEIISRIAEMRSIEREENPSMICKPFCDGLLTLGICYSRSSCLNRHVLVTKDRPREDIPRNGIVKFQIIKFHSPVHFSVRLLEHKAINRKKSEKIPNADDYLTFQLSFQNYFLNLENHTIHHPPKIGDLCAIKEDSDSEGYKRCKIIAVDATKLQIKLKVLMIDSNEIASCRSNEMLALPDQFQRFPPQAVDIRISGVVPHDLDTKWNKIAFQNVKEWLVPNENSYLQAKIELALMDTIWVDDVVVVHKLNAINQTINSMSVKKNLVIKNFGVPDTNALQLLKNLAEKTDILDTRPYNFVLVHVPAENEQQRGRRGETAEARPNHEMLCVTNKSNNSSLLIPSTSSSSVSSLTNNKSLNRTAEKWETLEKNQFIKVTLMRFYNPTRFYVQRKDTTQRMKRLYKNIDKFLADPSNLVPVSEIAVNQLCLAKSDEEYYDRAKILTVDHDGSLTTVRLFFVDLGTICEVSSENIIDIPNYLVEMVPFQIIFCKITGIRPLNNEHRWDNHTCDAIYDDILDKCSNIFVRQIKETRTDEICNQMNCISYEAIFEDKIFGNINKLIVSSKLAEYDPETSHYTDLIVDRRLFDTKSNDSDESDWEGDESRPIFDAGSYLNKEKGNYQLLQSDGGSMYGSDHEIDMDIQFDEEDINQWLGLPKGAKFLMDDNKPIYESPLPQIEDVKIKSLLSDPAASQTVTSSAHKSDEVVAKPSGIKSNLVYPTKNAYVTWQQTDDRIILTISAPDVTDYYLKITSRLVHFCYVKGNDKFETILNLFGSIDVNYASHEIRGLNVIVNLLKTVPALPWPQLRSTGGKNHFIKSKFIERDDDDESVGHRYCGSEEMPILDQSTSSDDDDDFNEICDSDDEV